MGLLSFAIGIILGFAASGISQMLAAQTAVNNSIAQNLRTQQALRDALGACQARDREIRVLSQRVQSLQASGEKFSGQLAKTQQRLAGLRATAQAIPDGQLWADLVESERLGNDLRRSQPFRGLSFRISSIRWNAVLTIFSAVQLLAQIRSWRLSVIEVEQAAERAMNTPCDESGEQVTPNNLLLIQEALNEI